MQVWANVKNLYSSTYGSQRVGNMQGMLRHLGMHPSGQQFTGMGDCANLANLLKRLLNDGCVVEPTYQLSSDELNATRLDQSKPTRASMNGR